MKYGLLGKKLAHSYSPMIHRAIGNKDYSLIEIPPEALGEFLQKGDFAGVNVTIPYKQDVIPYCAQLSDTAKKIGAVNTIVNRGGRLIGHNTDYDGFLHMADRAGIAFENKKVLILGSGGTALTASHAAADRGAREVLAVSRRGPVNYDNIFDHKDADVLINTTPVGMYPDNGGMLVDIRRFPNLSGVIDVIYNPLRTNLILDAEALKIPHANGLSMLVAQAVFASALFFETAYDTDLIEKVLAKIEKTVQNIVLVGMPGSGKSTVGRALATALGRPFIDTDTEIEKRHGVPPSEILLTQGEDYFRDLESAVVRAVAKESGTVIATGGGVPIREENRRALRQNGFVCFLQRPLERLDTNGRPLSQSGSLEALYRRRLPCYQAAGHVTVENNGSVEETVRDILFAFEKERTALL